IEGKRLSLKTAAAETNDSSAFHPILTIPPDIGFEKPNDISAKKFQTTHLGSYFFSIFLLQAIDFIDSCLKKACRDLAARQAPH
ncbi:hypothetical protein, partial [Methylocapsa sp. S129]|uniref:hypothetical protein n=1 Tax=Methylocapsa sp. S129 TaxID=1641869 RepID=UPI00131B5173